MTTANEPAIRSLSVPGPTQESWVLGCGYKNYVLHGTPCKDGPLLGLRVIVPLELRYPVYFMAQFETTTDVTYYASSEVSAPGKYLDIAVLTKQSSASPWRLALDTGYSNSNIKAAPPFIAFSPDSMGLDGPPGAHSPVLATQLAPLLVHYLQSCKDNGTPPRNTPLVSGNTDAAYQGCLLVAKTHQGAVSNGLRLSAYWEPDPAGGLWTFGIDPPGASPRYVSNPLLMACFTVLVRNIYTPARPSAVLAQQQDRANWGRILAPGLYSQYSELVAP